VKCVQFLAFFSSYTQYTLHVLGSASPTFLTHDAAGARLGYICKSRIIYVDLGLHVSEYLAITPRSLSHATFQMHTFKSGLVYSLHFIINLSLLVDFFPFKGEPAAGSSLTVDLLQGVPKNDPTCFCQNFVKSPPNLIIFSAHG